MESSAEDALRVSGQFESEDNSVLCYRPVTKKFELGVGTWRLDVWIPQSSQGPWKNHRIAGRLSGNALRCVQTKVEFEESPQLNFDMLVQTTKDRSSFHFVVSEEISPASVIILFSTRAAFLPVHFEFSLHRTSLATEVDEVIDSSQQEQPSQSSIKDTKSESTSRAFAGLGEISINIDEREKKDDEFEGGNDHKNEVDDLDDDEEDTEDGSNTAQKYSLEWLEKRFKRIPYEDKLRIAKEVAEAHARGWPSLDGACAAEFDNSLGKLEMLRESDFKSKAFEKGLIRPFLLLVSMHPGRRISWAMSLDINLARSTEFGDSHWESYEMLTHYRKGIVTRAMRTFREKFNPLSRKLDWYQLLHRVLSRVMTTKGGPKQLFGKEGMEPELRQKLSSGKVSKSISREFSSQLNLSDAPENLENLFARQFLVNRFNSHFDEKDELIPEQLDISPEEASSLQNVSKREFSENLINIVNSSLEYQSLAERLRKHGAREEIGVALAVLSAYRREALPVLFHEMQGGDAVLDRNQEQVDMSWNSQWGSQYMLMNEEFRNAVSKKCKEDRNLRLSKAALGIAIPSLVASLTLGPGIFSLLMISRAGFEATFPTLPASVAAVLSGIILQRYWLAVDDIGLKEFYPSVAESSGDFV